MSDQLWYKIQVTLIWLIYKFVFFLVLPVMELIYVGKTNYFMRYKILNLDKELTLDAIMNVRRVQHFADTYSIDDAFYVGRLTYRIRDKYTRMVRLYMLSYNNFDEYDINTVIHIIIIIFTALNEEWHESLTTVAF